MTWPAVFDGIGALVVRCDLDPAALVAKIRRHSPGLSWIAPKTSGPDITPWADIEHCVTVWRSLGLHVGSWVYCDGPPMQDVVNATRLPYGEDFTIYDVEAPYKSDEGGQHYEWSAELVAAHPANIPAAVTSYGAYKTSIDFGAFAAAGWPILAQCYDGFTPTAAIPHPEDSYMVAHGGVYPGGADHKATGIHQLLRSLTLKPGQAVYRPESIDG